MATNCNADAHANAWKNNNEKNMIIHTWLEEIIGWRKFIIIDLKGIEPKISLCKS